MALTKIPSSLLDTASGLDLQGNITLGDNEQIQLGDSSDLQIYHNGTHSYIDDTGTGDLRIKTNFFRVRNSGDTSNIIIADQSGAVTLYHNGDSKLATSSAGATVTGTLTVTGDLDITGNVNSYNVTDLDVTDQTITLGAGQTEANSGGSGIIIDGSNASILWDETNDEWDFNKSVKVSGSIGVTNIVTNKVVKFNGTILDDSIITDNGTSVGIDQPSPSSTYKLDVSGAIRSNTSAPGLTLRETDASNQEWLLGSYGGTFAIRDVTGGTYPVYVEAATPSSTLYLDSTGNVGIGTPNPKTLLDISSDMQSIITLSGTTSNGQGELIGGIYFYSADGSYNGPNNAAKITAVASTGTGADAELIFSTIRGAAEGDDALEAMRIDASGNVGIGTDDPATELHIASGSPILTLQDTDNTEPLATYIDFLDSAGNEHGWIGYGSGSLDTMQIANAYDDIIMYTGTAGAASERMRITSSGNVGIGTDNPGYQLDLRRNDTGTTPSLGIRQIGTGDASMAFQTTTSPYGFIIGVDASDGEKFKISTGVSDIAADTKLAIDTSGNTVIRGSSSNSALHVVGSTLGGILLKQNAQVTYTPADEANFQQGITFENSGSGHAFSIGYGQGGVLKFSYFDNGSTYSEIAQLKPTGDFYPAGSVIMNAGEGISFAATSQASGMSSELLDDYEEGTWTPVLGASATQPSVTYVSTYTAGRYIKIGGMVFATFEVRYTAQSGGSGDARITGLPFTRADVYPDADRGSAADTYGITYPTTADTYGYFLIPRNESYMNINYARSGSTPLNLNITSCGTSSGLGFIRGSITYTVV